MTHHRHPLETGDYCHWNRGRKWCGVIKVKGMHLWFHSLDNSIRRYLGGIKIRVMSLLKVLHVSTRAAHKLIHPALHLLFHTCWTKATFFC